MGQILQMEQAMEIDGRYRDGLHIRGDFGTNAWVRKSVGGTYDLQAGAGSVKLLNAAQLITLAEALLKYAKDQHKADSLHDFAVTVGTKGA